jgi:FkbM family methyltransferase
LNQLTNGIKRVLKRTVSKYPAIAQTAWSQKARAAGLTLTASDVYFDLARDGKVLRIRSSHAIYIPHMIESFDYYINSVVPVRDGGRQIVDMSGPRYHRLIGYGDIPFLFSSQTEPYETTKEYLEFAGLKEGQTVLDIGAYSGVTSIIFAQLVGPTGHVYAFEADETNHECAKTNLEMAAKVMGVRNVTLLKKAMWSHCDGLIFSNEGSMGSSAVEITGGGRGKEQKVESTTIEQFCLQQKITRVDFIKIDIEGGEVQLLTSSASALKNLNAKLIIEPHKIEGKLVTEQCCNLLRSHGYAVHVREKTVGSEALIEAVPA